MKSSSPISLLLLLLTSRFPFGRSFLVSAPSAVSFPMSPINTLKPSQKDPTRLHSSKSSTKPRIYPDTAKDETNVSVGYASGLVLPISLIFALSISAGEFETAGAPRAFENIVDAAVPMDTIDIVSIALGEALAGALGTVATFVTVSILKFQSQFKRGVLRDTLMNADYFLTRAATYPFLKLMGMSSSLMTSLVTVLLSVIPYELMKLMQASDKIRSASTVVTGGEETEGVRVEQYLPELFGDVMKWLMYDILKDSFGGMIELNGVIMGEFQESAAFGFLAALSSQLYLLAILKTTPSTTTPSTTITIESQKRWSKRIIDASAKCVESAVLFGVYESTRIPVGLMVTSLLAGSVDGCLESTDYDLCRETFVANTPFMEASPEAQIRALTVSVYSLWTRIQDGF